MFFIVIIFVQELITSFHIAFMGKSVSIYVISNNINGCGHNDVTLDDDYEQLFRREITFNFKNMIKFNWKQYPS